MSRKDFDYGYRLGAAFADAQKYAIEQAEALPALPAELQTIFAMPEPSDEVLGVYQGYLDRVCGVMPNSGEREGETDGL